LAGAAFCFFFAFGGAAFFFGAAAFFFAGFFFAGFFFAGFFLGAVFFAAFFFFLLAMASLPPCAVRGRGEPNASRCAVPMTRRCHTRLAGQAGTPALLAGVTGVTGVTVR
jgi:hypothetical protein